MSIRDTGTYAAIVYAIEEAIDSCYDGFASEDGDPATFNAAMRAALADVRAKNTKYL